MSGVDEASEWSEAEFEAALARVAADGSIQAAGVQISAERLAKLLGGAANGDAQRPDVVQRGRVDFTGATFTGDADFSRVTFVGDADFTEVTFSGKAHFLHTTFSSAAYFRGARFSKSTAFGSAAFNGPAFFEKATFSDSAAFYRTMFSDPAHFNETTFSGVQFASATFDRGAFFDDAMFSASARFEYSTFRDDATFGGASFRGDAVFHAATFSGLATFGGAAFSGGASFGQATFSGSAYFGEAKFGSAHFPSTTFSRPTYFDGATFGTADFGGTKFRDSAYFRKTIVTGDARFEEATFDRARELGPLRVFDRLWLDKAIFTEAVRIEASARRASFARAVFRTGADVRLRWAEVWLEDADFGESSLVVGLPARLTPGAERAFLGWEEPGGESGIWCMHPLEDPPSGFEPRVLSLRGARVGGLTLSGLDLRACRFAGAHGLDKLRLEQVGFAEPPPGSGPVRWSRESWQQRWFRIRWTRRKTIAEEHQWRGWEHARPAPAGVGQQASDPPSVSGSVGSTPPPPWPPEQPERLEAEPIAAVYRALRKGHEDSKDEPGAADFYYGEMEMRRHDRSTNFAERAVLWMYWLVSGYALRSSRALLALVLAILVFAVLFDQGGRRTPRGPSCGLRRSSRAVGPS